MMGVGLIVAFLPGQIMELSGSMRSVGYLASAFAVPFVLFQLPMGRLGDRYGCKTFIVIGYLLASLAGLLYFKSETAWGILSVRLLQGVGEIPTLALAPALLSLLFSRSKGAAIGIYNASIHLGLTTGSLLSLSFAGGGRVVFLVYAATSLIAALAVSLFVREPMTPLRQSTGGATSWSEIFRALRAIPRPAIHGGIILYGGGYGTFVTVVPAVLLREGILDQRGVSLFFALFYISISLAQIVAGRISDRRGRDVTLYAGLGFITAGVALFTAFEGMMVLALLSLAAFGLGMFCVSALALLCEAVPPSLRGSASGLFYLLWGIGYFLMPPLLSWAGGLVGYGTLFPLVGLLFLAELVALRLTPTAGR